MKLIIVNFYYQYLSFKSSLFDEVILDLFKQFFQCQIIKSVGRQLLLNAVAHLCSTKKDIRMQEPAMHTYASKYLQKVHGKE